MFKLLPLFASLCVACSPTSDHDKETLTPTTRPYATQVSAPSPDYSVLLEQPALEGESSRQRKASSPIPPDAKSIGDAWIARLEKRGALIGYGLAGKEADQPVEMVDTGLTEKEFVTWANENGWHVPEHIHWNFVPGLNLPRVSDTAKNAIRVWPASTARTGLQHLALYYGRIELRDGCFFVGQFDQPANKLAWFHAELGLDIDASGYFILRKSG